MVAKRNNRWPPGYVRKTAAQKCRDWRQRHPERAALAGRNWRKNNPDKVRAINRRAFGLPEPTRPEPLLCECCRRPPNGKGSLHLDHDHTTGAFRGWLCSRCNTSIGGLGDDVAGLQRAMDYLKRE